MKFVWALLGSLLLSVGLTVTAEATPHTIDALVEAAVASLADPSSGV